MWPQPSQYMKEGSAKMRSFLSWAVGGPWKSWTVHCGEFYCWFFVFVVLGGFSFLFWFFFWGGRVLGFLLVWFGFVCLGFCCCCWFGLVFWGFFITWAFHSWQSWACSESLPAKSSSWGDYLLPTWALALLCSTWIPSSSGPAGCSLI